MALKRPTPKKLSAAEFAQISAASAAQTGKMSVPKSYDEANNPVFDIPVNGKVLVYVPNHTVVDENGMVRLRADKFAAHAIKDGRITTEVRCTAGLVNESLGLDGSCPFCDASQEVWELYNFHYQELCKSRGLDPNNEDTYKQVESEAKKLRDKRAVAKPTIKYTFPIVVVECQKKPDGSMSVTPLMDAEGNLQYKVCWYNISENAYTNKWIKALDGLTNDDDTEVETPAGRWFILNYEYDAKDGQHTKMDSARNLAVTHKQMSEKYAAVAQQFDALTEDWTPERAMEFLVANQLRDMDEQNEACNDVMKTTRDELAQIAVAKSTVASGAPQIAGGADAALAAFGAATTVETPQIGTAAQVGVAPADEVPQATIA